MKPTIINIDRTRGDTYPEEFELDRDLTGATVVLTINPSAEPEDDSTHVAQVTGTITDAEEGVVEFAGEAFGAIPISDHRFDIRVTDAEGVDTTDVRGRWRTSGGIGGAPEAEA